MYFVLFIVSVWKIQFLYLIFLLLNSTLSLHRTMLARRRKLKKKLLLYFYEEGNKKNKFQQKKRNFFLYSQQTPDEQWTQQHTVEVFGYFFQLSFNFFHFSFSSLLHQEKKKEILNSFIEKTQKYREKKEENEIIDVIFNGKVFPFFFLLCLD